MRSYTSGAIGLSCSHNDHDRTPCVPIGHNRQSGRRHKQRKTSSMKIRARTAGIAALIVALGVGVYTFKAHSQEGPSGMHRMGPGMIGMGPGMMGMAHDEATMAQLQVIHTMLVNHDRITRTVTNLPNGIRTVTEFRRSGARRADQEARRRHGQARCCGRRSRAADRER